MYFTNFVFVSDFSDHPTRAPTPLGDHRLHDFKGAASLCAAEGASAAATAAARATRAEAMEMEATAAAEKAEAWKKAAAASTDVAAAKEQVQREAAELVRREETMGQVGQQQRERRAKMMVRY